MKLLLLVTVCPQLQAPVTTGGVVRLDERRLGKPIIAIASHAQMSQHPFVFGIESHDAVAMGAVI